MKADDEFPFSSFHDAEMLTVQRLHSTITSFHPAGHAWGWRPKAGLLFSDPRLLYQIVSFGHALCTKSGLSPATSRMKLHS